MYISSERNDSMEIWLEIAPKYRVKFSRKERPTLLGIGKFIAKVCETGFIVNAPRYERVLVLSSIVEVA